MRHNLQDRPTLPKSVWPLKPRRTPESPRGTGLFFLLATTYENADVDDDADQIRPLAQRAGRDTKQVLPVTYPELRRVS